MQRAAEILGHGPWHDVELAAQGVKQPRAGRRAAPLKRPSRHQRFMDLPREQIGRLGALIRAYRGGPEVPAQSRPLWACGALFYFGSQGCLRSRVGVFYPLRE